MERPSPMVIEVTVISAEGLFVSRKQPAKKSVSITVKTDPFNSRSTVLDAGGGSGPAQKEKLVMELPGHTRYITVEARSGSRAIGAASIAVSEFCGGYPPENHLSFLSYRLRGAGGEKNGIVNLSVKVKGTGNGACAAGWSRPWMGIPTVENKMSGGIVTGIPVSYRC